MVKGQTQSPPPNAPGQIHFENEKIEWTYHGKPILTGQVIHADGDYKFYELTEKNEGKVHQLLVIESVNEEHQVQVDLHFLGGPESFACEADRPLQQVQIVRHSFGPSHSLLNRAVYDRTEDRVLSVDHNPHVRMQPVQISGDQHIFQVQIEGNKIVIRFRPRFYNAHKGLVYYRPWEYRIWEEPVVGWCSWFAFWNRVTEEDIHRTADVMAEELLPYGFEYLQLDDGYQQIVGAPEMWIHPNRKFPGGLKSLAQYIKDKGLKPGIWTGVNFHDSGFVKKNPALFVPDKTGAPAYGRWVGYSIDGSSSAAMDRLVRPLYRELKQMGWEYFKVDALRHLRYEGYNANLSYFEKKNVTTTGVFRNLLQEIREETGREHFMLGCWGIRPELIGIIDGCRIGTDGYSFAGLAQYNSFNNVVWRNDPDHIELSPEEAYRSSMVTSLTGSIFLLTDKPELYKTSIVEAARKSSPVLFTRPGQLYEVDPSRIIHLDQVSSQVSGTGPRIFDAGLESSCNLFLLEINKAFDQWTLLGRTGGEFDSIDFNELGLSEEREYLVYEFWTGTLLGSFTGAFNPGPIDDTYHCQLFCIREREARPQLIATDRHITCGGVDLTDMNWSGTTLSGTSEVIPGRPYTLTIHEPGNFEFMDIECNSVTIAKQEKVQGLRKITIDPGAGKLIQWKVTYRKL